MNINDLNKIEVPVELDERVQTVYKKYEKKRKDPIILRVAAACLIIFLTGFAFPGYTQNLPIYSKIFSLFERTKYQEFGEEVLIESRSNGIKITLTDMIYTGDVLSYGYILESDGYLGEIVDVDWWFEGNIVKRSGYTSVRYQGENTYVGWAEWYLDHRDDTKEKEDLDFVLCAEKIKAMKDKSTPLRSFDGNYDKIYKGDWKFPIHIPRIPGERVIRPDRTIQKEGFSARLDRIFIDKVETKFRITIQNEHGYPEDMYEVDVAEVYGEDGKIYKTDGFGQLVMGEGDHPEARFKMQTSLQPGSYRLVFELSKTRSMDYYDIDGKLVDEPYDDSEEFKKAPERIEMSIPFEVTELPENDRYE